MPSILNQFQEMEESRFATLLSAVRCYFIFQGTISTFIDERAKEMQTKIGEADASVDIKDFIEKSKTKEKKPDPLVLEVHKGKYPETLPKDQRGASAVKPSEAVQAKPAAKEEPKDTNIINSPKLTTSSSLTSSAVKSETASPAQARAEPKASTPVVEAAPATPPVQEKPQPPRPANRDLFKGLFGDDAESDIFSDNSSKPLAAKKSGLDEDLLGSINENDTKLFGN
eukprot:TRINITY_DN3523_c0_g1_i2.p1 TRINITY_DN3523_c0_g1~~TRINITY_DN3523_c0_g1_i2.p1  ORF type:complete len:227 (-),score=89.56 TRINITY_DN3523_c0_g1_i2:62-742(-)